MRTPLMLSHAPPAWSDARAAVDPFADEVGMTVVAGVLGNHVRVDPPQRDFAGRERAGLIERAIGTVLSRLCDLALPDGVRGVEGDVVM